VTTIPTRHPRNTSFEWTGHEGPLAFLTDAQMRAFDEDGYFLLEGAFDAAEVARVVDAIDPIHDRNVAFLKTRENEKLFIAEAGNLVFSTHLVLRSPFLRDWVAGPVFGGLARDIIGPDVRLYWEQAVYKEPEKPRSFPWHQDNGYTFVEPQQYLTCWVALTDATIENGCPWVMPGLHRLGTFEHWMTDYGWECLRNPEGAVAVPARAGDIVVFSSLTPHLTGPNTSGAVRKAYIVQYAPDGAVVTGPGAASGGRQDDPDRQYLVLRGGEPVSPPPMPTPPR
jgi:ectoine hydroxylase-related dioxygenase (phytanoyl-CoA dioxygenase family)